MIYVGIDVASNKHDCFIMRDTGEVFSKKSAKAHVSSIDKILHHKSNITASKLIEIAKASIGQSEDYLAFELKHTIDMIRFY